jgi:hypothetical protein
MDIVRHAVAEREAALEPFAVYTRPSLLGSIRDMLLLADRYRLQYHVLQVSRESVLVRGKAMDWTGSEYLQKFLEDTGYRATLNRTDTLDQDSVPFVLSAEARDQ